MLPAIDREGVEGIAMKSEGLGHTIPVPGTSLSAVESVDRASGPDRAQIDAPGSSPRMVPHALAEAAYSDGFFPPPRFHELPPEILGKVFDLLTTDPDFCKALTRLSRTGKEFNQLIVSFVNNYHASAGRGFAVPAQIQVWKARAEFIKANVDKIKEDFAASQHLLSGRLTAKTDVAQLFSAAEAAQLNAMTGVEFKLQDAELHPAALHSLLSKLEGKVIRLDAKGIGRERFLNEVLPALRSVNAGCQIVLDASGNQLGSADLKPLLDYLSINPRIYRLDLSGNPLCVGEGPATEVLQLFSFAGPLPHLFLSDTGFNDATAAGLPQTMAHATGLANLYLRDNRLTADGALAVMQAIAPDSDATQSARTSIRRVQLTDNDYEMSDELRTAGIGAHRRLMKAALADPVISAQDFDFPSPLYLFGQRAVFELGKSSVPPSSIDAVPLGIKAAYYEMDEVDQL